MKKKVFVFSILSVILFLFFVPFTQQKTFSIKAPLYNTYQQLAKADNWKKWRTDLRRAYLSDSTKISDKQDSNGFKLSYHDITLLVNIVNGYTFSINENNKNDYSYTVIPEKMPNVTSIIVTEKTNFIKHLSDLINKKSYSETHITDLKHFMEDPDLYYGYKIIKKKVTDTNIIVLRKVVLAKNKFSEAAKTLITLKQFIDLKGFKQTQPLIAQFFTKTNDSLQVNIGLPINGKIAASNPITFMQMPPNGNLYTVKFHGKFKERAKVYDAVHQYFNDRNLPMPILPFETYLDNKLPENDSDIVNIQINFTTF
jgi:effector-binding domain-containing protein